MNQGCGSASLCCGSGVFFSFCGSGPTFSLWCRSGSYLTICCWLGSGSYHSLLPRFGPSIAPKWPSKWPFNFDADPDPAFHFDADPDPAFHFDADADPDPAFRNGANPLGSGSATPRWTITEITTVVQTLTLHQEQLRPTAGFPNLDPSLDWKCLLQKLHLPCNQKYEDTVLIY